MERPCVVCNILAVEKHDFNLIKGKSNLEDEIVDLFIALLPGNFVGFIQNNTRDKIVGLGLLSSRKYICKQCLRLLKKTQNLKANLKNAEREFITRITNLMSNIQPGRTNDRPNESNDETASGEKVNEFLALPALPAPASTSTPLKRTTDFSHSENDFAASLCSPPICKPRKVILIESNKKSSKGKEVLRYSSSSSAPKEKVKASVHVKKNGQVVQKKESCHTISFLLVLYYVETFISRLQMLQ